MDRLPALGTWLVAICGGPPVMVVDYCNDRSLVLALRNVHGEVFEMIAGAFAFRPATKEELPNAQVPRLHR